MIRSADPRVHRSCTALLAAVTGLVREKPVDQVSITGIAAAAGVTRPTFYQYFEDVPSAVRAAALHQLNAAYPPADHAPGAVPPERLREMVEDRVRSVLQHLWQDRVFYRRVFDGAANIDLFDALAEIISDRMTLLTDEDGAESGRKLMLTGGLMWMVVKWLRTEPCPAPPDAMARRLVDLVLKMGAP